MRLIGEPVEHGLAEPGIGEDLRPFRKRQVGGHNDGRFLRPLGDDLEEQFGGNLGQRDIAQFSSEKRLARLLLLMANFGQESKPIPLIAKMSQETLAEMIGTTRSRVSFFLNRFRDLGFIEYDGGGMHVHSSLVSVVLHD